MERRVLRIPGARPSLSYRRQNMLFLAPYLLGTLVLVVVPALMTLAVSFTDYHGIQAPTWFGLDNFRRLGKTPLVRVGLYNTLVFAAAAVPLRSAGGARAGAAPRRARTGRGAVPCGCLPADGHARGGLCPGLALDLEPGLRAAEPDPGGARAAGAGLADRGGNGAGWPSC